MNDLDQKLQPEQAQDRQPGIEAEMDPLPDFMPREPGSGRLAGKVALISGGDSGIGRAVAVAFAREGADIAFCYLDEDEDAEETVRHIENEGGRAAHYPGDIGDPGFCEDAVRMALERFGKIDLLVNNAAEQHVSERFEDIPPEQVERTFRTNVFGVFNLTRACLPHLRAGSAIINTTSVTAFKGSPALIDYAATRGAIVAFTRSLSQALVERGIRVNAVAPGPVWTPLIPASFEPEKVARHGASVPMKRAAQPWEIAASYVFLASAGASYMTGQVLHPNGGVVVGA